ncbi:hypothetical protein MMC11_004486 [Xylographa trunciseda]|nr:hypothetical protein [Xylographa trunciseda]
MPNPTESSLLTHLLLPPASLPAILTLQKFTALFPSSVRSNPQIPFLYRDLQHQRALRIDEVRKNIATEVIRGESMKREVIRTRRREERGGSGLGIDADEDGDMEGLLASLNGSGNPHTLASMLRDLDTACRDMEAETTELEDEAGGVLSEMQVTVGGLSDLRYGRFAVPVREEVLEGLDALRKTAGGIPNPSDP